MKEPEIIVGLLKPAIETALARALSGPAAIENLFQLRSELNFLRINLGEIVVYKQLLELCLKSVDTAIERLRH